MQIILMIQINFYSNGYFFQILLLQITSISYVLVDVTVNSFYTNDKLV